MQQPSENPTSFKDQITAFINRTVTVIYKADRPNQDIQSRQLGGMFVDIRASTDGKSKGSCSVHDDEGLKKLNVNNSFTLLLPHKKYGGDKGRKALVKSFRRKCPDFKLDYSGMSKSSGFVKITLDTVQFNTNTEYREKAESLIIDIHKKMSGDLTHPLSKSYYKKEETKIDALIPATKYEERENAKKTLQGHVYSRRACLPPR